MRGGGRKDSLGENASEQRSVHQVVISEGHGKFTIKNGITNYQKR